METLILKFKLPTIGNLEIINAISSIGYRKTGNKFSINFHGSKGYLNHIEITCEGVQKERNNIIWIQDFLTKKGTLKSKTVSIYHSNHKGIRLSI